MVDHYNEHKHPIAFSFADFSYWCYECDSYLEHAILNHQMIFYEQKFGGTSSQAEILERIRKSKFEDVIKEEDENENDDEEKQN